MPKSKNENRDIMTDEEFLAAVRTKPNPVAVREAIFEIGRKMAMENGRRGYKGISWPSDLDDD